VDVKLLPGDCLEQMAALPAQSVDMVLCDLPYGVTACSWDAVIPFDKLWAAYARVVKERGAIVLTSTQPFASALVMSNPKWFRHEWVWDKVGCAGFQLAKYRPMQQHEHALVFGQESPKYYPIMSKNDVPQMSKGLTHSDVSCLAHDDGLKREHFYQYPRSILSSSESACPHCGGQIYVSGGDVITVGKKWGKNFHSSEKPVALLAYLIQTYSRRGDVVMDNTMGSGSTGVACVIEGRNFIGIEQDFDYYNVACGRIEEARAKEGFGHDFGTDSTGVLISRVVPESTFKTEAMEFLRLLCYNRRHCF